MAEVAGLVIERPRPAEPPKCALGCGREASERRSGRALCWWCSEIVGRWITLQQSPLRGLQHNAAAGTFLPPQR